MAHQLCMMYAFIAMLVMGCVATAPREDPPQHWPVGAAIIGVFWLPLLLLGMLAMVWSLLEEQLP
jgi:hypothetical protein